METNKIKAFFLICLPLILLISLGKMISVNRVFTSSAMEEALQTFIVDSNVKNSPEYLESGVFVIINDIYELGQPIFLLETNSAGEISYPTVDEDVQMLGECLYKGLPIHISYSKKYSHLIDNKLSLKTNMYLYGFFRRKKMLYDYDNFHREAVMYEIQDNNDLSFIYSWSD